MQTGFPEPERDISKFKETRATGRAADAILPCAFTGGSFKAIAWSDPQLIFPVILIDVFRFLSH